MFQFILTNRLPDFFLTFPYMGSFTKCVMLVEGWVIQWTIKCVKVENVRPIVSVRKALHWVVGCSNLQFN